MPSAPRVGIVILNWNNYQDTTTCLNSLQRLSYANYEIYVVDNGSTDDSAYRLEDDYPTVEFVRNGYNLGFAGGCNVGIERALEEGCEYILLLNNDTEVNGNTLNHLVSTAENHKKSAIVGGKIYQRENCDKVWYSGGLVSDITARVRHQKTNHDDIIKTEFVTGCLMLLDSKFVREHGGLPEDYFLYFEDAEISCRARKNGWNVLVNRNAQIYHKIGSSTGETTTASPTRAYYASRNQIKLIQDHSISQLLGYMFFLLTRPFVFAKWYLRGGSDVIKASIRGLIDGFLSRSGRHPKYP